MNVDPDVKPDLVSISDGNEDAYGTAAYARWTLLDGTRVVNLIMSKAKLGPLTHNGEVVKNELSGATFSARLKCWIIEHTKVEFGNFFHFLDSRIVQDMIMKESYGFNTFAGLRVGEIQRKTDIMKWLHIASEENIADVLIISLDLEQLGSMDLLGLYEMKSTGQSQLERHSNLNSKKLSGNLRSLSGWSSQLFLSPHSNILWYFSLGLKRSARSRLKR